MKGLVIGSPEWQAERLHYVGASEVAEAVGLSPWGDPISLWAVKRGLEPPRDETFRMRLGTLTEPIIGQLAAERLQRRLMHVSGPIMHASGLPLGASPDFRVVGERALVQAKLSEADWTEGIPLHYRLQGWAELACTGLDVVHFAVLDQRTLRLFPLERDDEAIDDLLADVADFWHYVESGEVPPATWNSGEALKKLFPHATPGEVKTASPAQEETLERYLQARGARMAAEKSEDEAKNRVVQMIGAAEAIEGLGKRFSYKGYEKTEIAWDLIARAYRSVIAELRKDLEEGADEVALDGVRAVDFAAIEGLYTAKKPYRRIAVGEL